MTIYGVTSVFPVAIPALAQVANSSARIKTQTKKRLEARPVPSPSVGDKYIPLPSNESNLDLAKSHFKAGKSYYEKKKYEAALDEFQKSYGLIRILDTQYNIGLCYEKLGTYDKAITALQLYVEGKPGKKEQEEAEDRIAWIQSEIKSQKKEEPQGEAVAVVTPSEEQSPPPKPVQTAKVTKKIKREKIRVPADETWKMLPQEEAAGTSSQKVEEKPKAVVPPIPTPLVADTYVSPRRTTNTMIDVAKKSDQSPIPYRNLMWTSFALSAVSLTTGVIAHFAAKGKEEDYFNLENRLEANGQLKRDTNGHPSFTSTTADNENRSQLNALKDEVNTRGDIAIAGFVGAGVFLGLGALFYKLSPDRVTLTGGVQANGGRVNMQVRF